MSSTVFSNSSEISSAKTCAPSFYTFADACPIPVLAPVMTAILFSKRFILSHPSEHVF